MCLAREPPQAPFNPTWARGSAWRDPGGGFRECGVGHRYRIKAGDTASEAGSSREKGAAGRKRPVTKLLMWEVRPGNQSVLGAQHALGTSTACHRAGRPGLHPRGRVWTGCAAVLRVQTSWESCPAHLISFSPASISPRGHQGLGNKLGTFLGKAGRQDVRCLQPELDGPVRWPASPL